jgi:hypothetical protein
VSLGERRERVDGQFVRAPGVAPFEQVEHGLRLLFDEFARCGHGYFRVAWK